MAILYVNGWCVLSEILIEYDKLKPTYESYSRAMMSLISSLLLSHGINIHSISVRVKERRSLELKVDSKGGYEKISDITDVVGLRIISHYADEVDLIANVIEQEFFIDKENSIDKRESLGTDRFGYLSLHYIVTIDEARSKLTEYKEFKDIKFEIQVRSILQHTWAEIEHDIGYKSEAGIPAHMKRKFSRLAGLLEIADSEFINIRDSLKQYEIEAKTSIDSGVKELLIDQVTLVEYLKNSNSINELVLRAKNEANFIFSDRTGSDFDKIFIGLSFFKINTISELDILVRENSDLILKRCHYTVESRKRVRITYANSKISASPSFNRDCICLYLAQALASKSGNIKDIELYLKAIGRRGVNIDNESFAEILVNIFT